MNQNEKTVKTTRSKRDVLNVLNAEERRLYEAVGEVVDYVPDDSFAKKATEGEHFGESAREIAVSAWTHYPEVPDEIKPRTTRRVALKAEDEAGLFLRYNYARYRLSSLVETQNRRASGKRAREIVLWYRRAKKAQSDLVGANMALVLAMAKRTRIPNVEFTELVSEGNMALLRSVEKFDVSRGYKFSTYACRSILKSFNRLATKTGRYRQRFPTEFDPKMEKSDYDVHKHEMQRDSSVDALRDILASNRAKLTEVERTIIMERFAILSRGKKRTLAEVGKMVGLTNERVRQLQNNALGKLRSILDKEYLVA